MWSNKTREAIQKCISVVTLYAVFINQIIPFTFALNTNEHRWNSGLSRHTAKPDIDVASSIVAKNEVIPESIDNDEFNDIQKTFSLTSVSGSGQPETTGATANSSANLIDPFSGNLSYSIEVANIEGLPITLAYDANVGMDQEASWVGLGWNLSMGSITREMRGIPDDFNGDQIERTMKMEPNTQKGKSKGINAFFGIGNPTFQNLSGTETKNNGRIYRVQDLFTPAITFAASASLRFGWGKYFNNYSGEGKTWNFGLQTAMDLNGIGIGKGIGFSSDNQNGIGFTQNSTYQMMPTVSGVSVGGFQYQKSLSTNSRSGTISIENSRNTEIGLSVQGSGYSQSVSRGSRRTLGYQTFVPRYQSPSVGITRQSTFSINGSFSGGPSSFFTYYGGGFSNDKNYTEKGIAQESIVIERPSYGYMNHSKGDESTEAILDFNRSSNTVVSSETKLLSFSIPTYDVFYCSAPGFSSSYRAHRYDVVEYHDPQVRTIIETTTKEEGTGQIGINEILEMNLNGGFNAFNLPTGGITTSNQEMEGLTVMQSGPADLKNDNKFDGINNEMSYNGEEYFLETQGEIKFEDESLINSYQGYQPSALGIEASSIPGIKHSGNLLTKAPNATSDLIPAQNYSLDRMPNNVHYREYRISELSEQEPKAYYETVCDETRYPSVSGSSVFTSEKLGHHIGKIEVTDGNGMDYIFGIPSYSYESNEVSFSASGLMVDNQGNPSETFYDQTGMVVYNSGDNSVNNNLGREKSYQKMSVPAYASSFLLTDMKSSDYIDRTGNGPSEDDQGNYYHINYSNPYNSANPFIWRSPMCSNEMSTSFDFKLRGNLANLNKGFHTDPWDDMASYSYGEKDIWYPVSVESKNLIAVFCLEDREDQYSMINENGGLDLTKPGRLLKKIKIFIKSDLLQNGPTAVPLQVVEFDYDYSLCKDYVGNSNSYNGNYSKSGKLTLKAVYTYSGSSGELKTAPIEFVYSSVNPEFNLNSNDRWGSYKPNDQNYPNHEIPYSDQSVAAETNIDAWKLVKINTVGGQTISISYDVDRYGYVQNERAMRMFKIVGMSNINTLLSINASSVIDDQNDLLVNGIVEKLRNPVNNKDPYNVIYFELEKPVKNSASVHQYIQDKYLRNESGNIPNEFLFNVYAKLGRNSEDLYEYVETVVKLDKEINGGIFAGVAGTPDAQNKYHYGWLVVKNDNLSQFDDDVNKFMSEYGNAISTLQNISLNNFNNTYANPIQVAVWQYARLNVPCAVYGDINYSATSATDFCDYSVSNDVTLFGQNLYEKLNKKGYGIDFDASKSHVRLFEPDTNKIGGGYVVNSIVINDNWGLYSGEYNSSYDYNTTYADEKDRTMGVASYEPLIGDNENPFYQLTAYSYPRFRLPDEKVYQKDPWGEMAYPTASVGYSMVSSTISDGSQIGRSVKYFHTAFDHPIIVDRTEIKSVIASGKNATGAPGMVSELFGFSQGFYVETNDYHGKPKRSEVYGTNDELISSTETEYYDFSSNLRFIKEDGNVVESKSPIDIDIYADSWSSKERIKNSTFAETVSFGFSMWLILGSPVPIPIIRYSKDDDHFRYNREMSAFTFNKVVHRYVLPKKVITSKLGSYNTAQNEFYDYSNGSVIVSSLNDEFDDKLYAMNYPGHWYYENLQNKSYNDGAKIPNSLVSGSANIVQQIVSPLGTELGVGDELEITDDNGSYPAWVLDIQGTDCYLIDAIGQALSGIDWSTASIKIERVGAKNLMGLNMMNLTTKKEPQVQSGNFVFPSDEIIDVSAVVLAENKDVPCIKMSDVGTVNESNYPSYQYKSGDIINPFRQGVMGNFRNSSSCSYQEDRTSFSAVTGIRQDGQLQNYEPFYALSAGSWYAINESGHPDNVTPGGYNDWRILEKTEKYDEFGKPLEVKDQLDISKTVMYGMNSNLKLFSKGNVSNAKASEVGFDGFEDYSYYTASTLDYLNYGFSLEPNSANAQIVSTKRHSGDYALSVYPNEIYSFDVADSYTSSGNIINGEYVIQDCNCLLGFTPSPGIVGQDKEYYFSTWVHEESTTFPFQNTSVVIRVYDANQTLLNSNTYSPSGAVIDSWQKIDGKYSIPWNAESIEIELVSADPGGSYFDDFRTHPYLAAMSTTVYDQKTLLPAAEHDAENFTLFYNYDDNHQLVRSRIETINGVNTVSESEAGNFRKQ